MKEPRPMAPPSPAPSPPAPGPRNRIRPLREAQGWTQRDLAARLGCTGMTVCRYEQDDDRLYPSLIRQLAGIFNCTPAEVAGFDHSPSGTTAPADVDKALLEQALITAHSWLSRQNGPVDVPDWAALAVTLYRSGPR